MVVEGATRPETAEATSDIISSTPSTKSYKEPRPLDFVCGPASKLRDIHTKKNWSTINKTSLYSVSCPQS